MYILSQKERVERISLLVERTQPKLDVDKMKNTQKICKFKKNPAVLFFFVRTPFLSEGQVTPIDRGFHHASYRE
jgi:hypothetical protein